MGVHYLYPVLSSEDTLIDVEAFLREGQRNGPGVRRRSGPLRKTGLTDARLITIPDGASTIISHFTDGRLISVDGADFEEAVEIAAWVRSLNPDPDVGAMVYIQCFRWSHSLDFRELHLSRCLNNG